jgi:hypothetical protein
MNSWESNTNERMGVLGTFSGAEEIKYLRPSMQNDISCLIFF